MSTGMKGTKGEVFNLTLPTPIADRLTARAAAIYETRNSMLRRFIIENIDVLAPVEGTP
jgi:hypothetical protein